MCDDEFRLSSSSSNSSNKTADHNQLGPAATAAAATMSSLPTPAASRLIQDQQVQIEALRAALSQQEQQRQQQSPPSKPSQHHPVHPIQVLTVSADQNLECTDDLTVWSGFHSAAAPPPRRPDAASVADGNGPSAPTTSSPIRLATRHVQLSSAITGLTRKAIFTGTLSMGQGQNPNNDLITGSGVLQFTETGDVYRGDLVDSEMHGYGSYTFANASATGKVSYDSGGGPKMLRGRFEHNVFVG
jgi:hypothetical protein